MINVLVKSKDMGKRKAFFIASSGEDYAIIVFKNNNPEKIFERVLISSLYLDMEYKPNTEPILENSVRKINLTLKSRKVRG